MKQTIATRVFALLAVAGLTGCALVPANGPSSSSINTLPQVDSSGQSNEEFAKRTLLIDIDPEVAQSSQTQVRNRMFSETWRQANSSVLLGVGDMIQVSIWEAPPAVLFGAASASGAIGGREIVLPAQMVDKSGAIRIPYAGQISAAGKHPRDVEKAIVQQLIRKANSPQVMVTRVKNNGASAVVLGDGGGGVQISLTDKGEKILDAVAAIGGVKSVKKATVQLAREGTVRSLPLSVITQNPEQNISLQAGDVVTILSDPWSFIALGATGVNQEINFEGAGISLAQAIGRVQGFNPNRANVSGVYIFRYEDSAATARIATNNSPQPYRAGVNTSAAISSVVPVVYKADMRNPNMMFYAQNFMIRDKDIIFVADAASLKWQQYLGLIGLITSPLNNIANTINNYSEAADRF